MTNNYIIYVLLDNQIINTIKKMKLICINERGWAYKKKYMIFFKKWLLAGGPKFGEVVGVVSEDEHNGKIFYQLDKVYDGPDERYCADEFIRVSDSYLEDVEEKINSWKISKCALERALN